MPERNGKRKLEQPSELSQTTKQGLEIPVPKTEDFDRPLKRAARKRDRREGTSQSETQRR